MNILFWFKRSRRFTMKRYFSIFPSGGESNGVSAFLPEDISLPKVLDVNEDGMFILPFLFTLKYIVVTNNGIEVENKIPYNEQLWPDYMPNSNAWPLFSHRMMEIIADSVSGSEKLRWILCHISHDTESKDYYVPCFQKQFDILDNDKCIYYKTGRIIKPVYAYSKIKEYRIFPTYDYNLWHDISPEIFISDDVRKKIKKAKLIGLDISNAPVAED